MMYTFRDGVAQLEGHAVQTMITGICLNDDCDKTATVTLHPQQGGVATCSYQLTPEGELSSVVRALTNVETVRVDNVKAAAANPDKFLTYGPVNRSVGQHWSAIGIRLVRLGEREGERERRGGCE